MRKDMFKVIVERERVGSSAPSDTKALRKYLRGFKPSSSCKEDREDWEEEAKLGHLPMKITGSKPQGYDSKSLNENLNPLKRFIASRVGRKWDDVWSEICENINSDSTVQKHVLDHAKDYVHVNCYFDADGNVWCNDDYRGPTQISPIYYNGYRKYTQHYAEPETGILKEIKVIQRKKEKKEEIVRINIGNNSQLHKLDNVWYVVNLKPFPRQPLTSPNGYGQNIINNYGLIVDCVLKKDLYTLNKNHSKLIEQYGSGEFGENNGLVSLKDWGAFLLGKNNLVYAAHKKQLGKKELKKYKLK